MIDFFLQSHRPIFYLKRQQKVHPAKQFENLRSREHGLFSTVVLIVGGLLDISPGGGRYCANDERKDKNNRYIAW